MDFVVRCQKWYHCGCLRMNEAEYKMWSGSDHPLGVHNMSPPQIKQKTRGDKTKNEKGRQNGGNPRSNPRECNKTRRKSR
jgi:hypothetical protein